MELAYLIITLLGEYSYFFSFDAMVAFNLYFRPILVV